MKGTETMKTMEQSWGRFLPRALVLGAIIAASVFVAVRAAIAREGEPGGHTRTALTVAGSLTVPAGATPSLTFRFYRGAAMATAPLVCGPIVVMGAGVRYVEATHTFSAEVPIDSTPACQAMFNGESVWVTTEVTNGPGGAVLLPETARSAVNPVPYARYADQYGTPDCPVGYERNPATPTGRVYCRRALSGGLYDEVVRVGQGASAFWIDRYEASVNRLRDASGEWLFESDIMIPQFPRNGQWGRARDGTVPPVFSVARAAGTQPAQWITWFQALEACAASGKALPTGSQWLLAASGTTDDPSGCQINSAGPRNAGGGSGCESSWGAQDMVGNLWEWTDDWYAGAGSSLATPAVTVGDAGVVPGLFAQVVNNGVQNWPTDYNGDATGNVNSFVDRGDGLTVGLPAVALRGGVHNGMARAGVFALDLGTGPSSRSRLLGFRCVIPR